MNKCICAFVCPLGIYVSRIKSVKTVYASRAKIDRTKVLCDLAFQSRSIRVIDNKASKSGFPKLCRFEKEHKYLRET